MLRQLEDVSTRVPRAREGLVLLGHRANHEVATILRIARAGLGSLVSPHGVYACTSQKEEFGVALLEAMATGLSVVAPNAGGPATYVEEGLTGSLADTSSVADVREALRRAAAARADESHAQRTSDVVARTTRSRRWPRRSPASTRIVVREPVAGGGVIVLVVVPDYASHWYPLSATASALRARGHRVVVATGRTLAPLVAADGYEHVELILGSGSNGGVRPADTDPELNAFFAATHEGMIATLRYQAERRAHDLLWEPQSVAGGSARDRDGCARHGSRRPARVRRHSRPARTGVPFFSFLPGHPCQLPGQGETFGYPELRPPEFGAPAADLPR